MLKVRERRATPSINRAAPASEVACATKNFATEDTELEDRTQSHSIDADNRMGAAVVGMIRW